MKIRTLSAAVLTLALFTGCASKLSNTLSDYHDPAALDNARLVEVKPSFTAGLTGGAIESNSALSKSGVVAFRYDTSRSSGENAYRIVKVSSSEAPNLRWEIWAMADGVKGLTSRGYAKIMGPYRNNEEAKLMFVNNPVTHVSNERDMMVVVYSPTETERKVSLSMSEVQR